jgi:hypothetical protein
MTFGRRKTISDKVYKQLHQYLRAGIEFLVPADEAQANGIEVATIVDALEKRDEQLASNGPPVESAADAAAAEQQRQLQARMETLESQLAQAEKTLRERDRTVETLKDQLQERLQPEIRPPKTNPNPPNLTADERANAILSELEDSRTDIEKRLQDSSGLSKAHIVQLKQDLALINKTRREIVARLELQKRRTASGGSE